MNLDDVCDLIAVIHTKDSEGYETTEEIPTTHFCRWRDGVSQNEFYSSHKAGFNASATVEIFAADYNKEKIVDFRGERYNVIRAYQREPDYVTLVLEEVIR